MMPALVVPKCTSMMSFASKFSSRRISLVTTVLQHFVTSYRVFKKGLCCHWFCGRAGGSPETFPNLRSDSALIFPFFIFLTFFVSAIVCDDARLVGQLNHFGRNVMESPGSHRHMERIAMCGMFLVVVFCLYGIRADWSRVARYC